MNLKELNELLGTTISSHTTFEVFNQSYLSDPKVLKHEWANSWKNKPTLWADFVSAIDAAWTVELASDIQAIRNDYELRLSECNRELARLRECNRKLNNKIIKITNILNNQEDEL